MLDESVGCPRGAAVQVATGSLIDPSLITSADIRVTDIALALANTCRFGGHTHRVVHPTESDLHLQPVFYSVAQHSVLVSLWCRREDALWGLLHDAAEAYLVDLPRPLKQHSVLGPLFVEMETKVLGAVMTAYGLPLEMPKSVAVVDNWLLSAEARDLMSDPEGGRELRDVTRELDEVPTIVPWDPPTAYREFLFRYYRLIRRGVDV